MADSDGEGTPMFKKRKIRRGTKSCWECKRRKIRCTFASTIEATCDSCRSRQTPCVSQDIDLGEKEVEENKTGSLDRVEELGAQMASQACIDLLAPHNCEDATTPTTYKTQSRGAVTASSSPAILAYGVKANPNLSIHVDDRYNHLCSTLRAVWPSQRDLDLITSVAAGTSVLFHGTVCMPYSKFLKSTMPSPQEALQLSPLESHPVLIARRLLLLGSFLQGISPSSGRYLSEMGINHREIMSHVVETANRLVTSNDDLVASLEGIECIMIESMYRNNGGNLRQAWLTNRRAMGVAQMMGLHLDKFPSPTVVDVDTRERIYSSYMWARLVMSDRYLSLVLGLPQGSQESHFATPEALEGCAPIDRMERIEAAAGGRILQRYKEDMLNTDTTYGIDKQLRDAAASMPAQWWLFPDVMSLADSDADAFNETLRIMNQFTHFHLLMQLHLPYLLQSSADRRYDYSKVTAVTASREILTRFVAFRGSDLVTSYCRGIEFLAFIASMTLCLAYIDASRQPGIGLTHSASVFSFLAHQRLGDRGLLERTLQIMEEMAKTDGDAIAGKIANMLRSLLDIEAAAADGDSYTASISSEPGEQVLSSNYNAKERNNLPSITISVPSLGSIRVESQASAFTQDKDAFNLIDDPLDVGRFLAQELGASSDDWALQGVDLAFFDSLGYGAELLGKTREELPM